MSTIINAASPGISNKIKSFLSLMRKYDVVKTTKHSDSYLFDNLEYISDGDMDKYPVIDNQEYMNQDMWRLKVYEEDIEHINEYKTIDLLYEKTPQYFIDKYLSIISKLNINPTICKYVDEFTKDWNNMVGVHVRSWYCSKKVFHSNKIFDEQIDKLSENEKFFFCSDNFDVQKYFEDRYGDRVVTYERQMFNDPRLAESGHHDDIQLTTDAFIELLILSKCATIIGTYASSFYELAWWMGGCKSKVIIPTPINCDKELEDFNNLIYIKK